MSTRAQPDPTATMGTGRPEARSIYLARRHPYLDHRQFIDRWRAHGVLAQRLPSWVGVRRYEQDGAISIDADIAARIPGLSDHDGVGMLWFHHDEAIVNGYGTPEEQRILCEDEEKTFDELVMKTMFCGRDRVSHGASHCAVKLVSFVDDEPADLGDRLLSAEGVAERVSSYVECLPIPTNFPGAQPALQGYGAVVEIGFASPDDLTEALRAPAFDATVLPAWRAAAGQGVVTVAVRELCLQDG